MANSEHVSWLLEDVQSWNARREQTEFIPDFEGEDLYTAFKNANRLDVEGRVPLSGTNLTRADFRNSWLSDRSHELGADLRNANLRGANLDDSEMAHSLLEGACLLGATFQRANARGSVFRQVRAGSTMFAGADLSECDFTGTKFNLTVLQDAVLFGAMLEDADLSIATLTGAELEMAQPWQARLYGEPDGHLEPNEGPVEANRIRRVSDLIDECRRIRSSRQDMVLYFRGESRIEDDQGKAWKLQPSVMRDATLRANERSMLMDLMSRRPEEFEHAQSALSQWVIAQHHGLKTRLLDISRNPLVALFNVCEDLENAGRLHVFSVPRTMIRPFSSDTIRVVANFAKLSRVDQNVLLGLTDCLDPRQRAPQLDRPYRQVMDVCTI